MGDKLCNRLIFAGPIAPVLSLCVYYGINDIHLLKVKSLPCDCTATHPKFSKNVPRTPSILRLIRARYQSDLTLPSSTLINLIHDLFTGVFPKRTRLFLMTTFHQFYFARLKLHHGLAFAVNPWVSSTHRPLSILLACLIDHETHVVLGLDLHEHRILRVRVLNHLSDWGMQIVVGRLLLRVLMQKYLLLRFIYMKNELFWWDARIGTCHTSNSCFLERGRELHRLSRQKLTLVVSFMVMQRRSLLYRS